MKKLILSLFITFSLTPTITAQDKYVPSKENIKAREDFQNKKFGIFIHWGIYSMLGQGEWVMQNRNINYKEYSKIAAGFYPSLFDANEWVDAIKSSGAKYITITSRHHDGFSMWNTQQTDYNIVKATPYKCDILKDIAKACENADIALHFYYSHLDWGREDYPIGRTGHGTGRSKDKINWQSYRTFMDRQLTELLSNYGKIGAIWFDGVWDHDQDATPFDWQLSSQYKLIHKLQPSCLVANNHHLVPFEGEDIQIFERDLPGENNAGYSGENGISSLPLESCETMNRTWGYNITDNDYKTTKQLIHLLVGAAGRNANFLLNIGPEPNGKLPDEAVKRLKEIGEWMSIYGETIYGTRGGFVEPHNWGVTTQKDNKLYVHVLNCQDNALFVPTGSRKIKSAKHFATGKKMEFIKTDKGIVVFFDSTPTDVDFVVELTYA